MHRYLDDLVETTFYGKTKTQVAQKLIELGIMEAIAKRHIDVRRKKKRPKKHTKPKPRDAANSPSTDATQGDGRRR